ncbi:SAM-dependent methyltransferase [Streptomyces sp. 3MP-14]|uniref:SAM-dependent methyltransferase n=1 Tax=Streptomyces mimosae TaxID=2586635 RepID=A0A5N6AD38_9ACTN|nr:MULTISPECIES: SAM-dependent methyltransferase [Streptomyces]KAB8166571.1 SAM-dependent methyltransferase [Streptomyces mimosae]KAB8179263.1 SAM-dependent methyltransferase [Streptomyces sp. 3MP-14]
MIDRTVPHSARIWNYWLGGRDYYAVDRAAGDDYCRIFPEVRQVARASREFLGRSIHYLAREAGITQFVDIGTGLPTAENTHQIAQRVRPDARIVYVDNDPLVIAHARALMASGPKGATDYVHADLRDPAGVLAAVDQTLDLDRPVGLILSGVLGHVEEYGEARGIVSALLAALPPGSHLSANDGVTGRPAFAEAQGRYNRTGAAPYLLRSRAEVAGFFDGLDLVEPGVVSCPLWRPTPGARPARSDLEIVGGVGRKP